MITVIRDRSGNIKTFSASPLESYNVALDETSEVLDILWWIMPAGLS